VVGHALLFAEAGDLRVEIELLALGVTIAVIIFADMR
jgi:hypothetical protein